jgi:imidazolonepropionase-like amidohydrolase
MMRKTLLSGVTTVRDCGSPDGLAIAIQKISSEGIIKAPRIIPSLSAIAITGGHGVAEGIDTVIEADGVEEVRKAVRKNLKNGAECIKLMDSEGYRGQEFNQDELNAAVDEAHRFGVKVAVHAGYGESMGMCIKAGVDSIEHGTHLSVEQAIEMKDKNITWVPTVYVFNYTYQALLAAKGSVLAEFFMKHKKYLEDSITTYKENLKQLYDTGVRICTGTDTDCTSFKGASPVAGECEYLVEYGLKPIEAIECATKNGADYLGLGDSHGQIKEGYTADIILVKGNPAEDISVLNDVVAVYQSGEKV